MSCTSVAYSVCWSYTRSWNLTLHCHTCYIFPLTWSQKQPDTVVRECIQNKGWSQRHKQSIDVSLCVQESIVKTEAISIHELSKQIIRSASQKYYPSSEILVSPDNSRCQLQKFGSTPLMLAHCCEPLPRSNNVTLPPFYRLLSCECGITCHALHLHVDEGILKCHWQMSFRVTEK